MDNYITNFQLNINKDSLYGFTSEQVDELNFNLLMNGDQGLQIVVPEVVDLDEREYIPVLWCSARSEYRDWEVLQEQNTYFILTQLETGISEVLNVFPSSKKRDDALRARSLEGEAPPREGRQMGAKVYQLDIRSLSSMQWGNGSFAVTLLTYDWKSNTEYFSLKSTETVAKAQLTPKDRNPNSFILSQQESQYGLLSELREAEAQEEGLILSVDEMVDLRFTNKLKGSVRIRLDKESFKMRLPGDQNNLADRTIGVPLCIIIASLDEFYCFNFNCFLPVEDSQSMIGKTVELPFEINLDPVVSTIPEMVQHPIQLYVSHSNTIAGPEKVLIK